MNSRVMSEGSENRGGAATHSSLLRQCVRTFQGSPCESESKDSVFLVAATEVADLPLGTHSGDLKDILRGRCSAENMRDDCG